MARNNETKESITFKLAPDRKQWLEDFAHKHRTSVSALVRETVNAELIDESVTNETPTVLYREA